MGIYGLATALAYWRGKRVLDAGNWPTIHAT